MRAAMKTGERLRPGDARRIAIPRKYGMFVRYCCASCVRTQEFSGEGRKEIDKTARGRGWVKRSRGYVCGNCTGKPAPLPMGHMRIAN